MCIRLEGEEGRQLESVVSVYVSVNLSVADHLYFFEVTTVPIRSFNASFNYLLLIFLVIGSLTIRFRNYRLPVSGVLETKQNYLIR